MESSILSEGASYCERRTSILCLIWRPALCHIKCQTVSPLTLSEEQLVLQAPAYQTARIQHFQILQYMDVIFGICHWNNTIGWSGIKQWSERINRKMINHISCYIWCNCISKTSPSHKQESVWDGIMTCMLLIEESISLLSKTTVRWSQNTGILKTNSRPA